MSESNRYNKTSIAKILLVLTLILLTMFTTTTLASIKLEAVNATNPIKLNANKDITLNLVLDTDTYKTNEEILAWAIFRIDNIPVASKEFDVEISKGDTIIDRFSTTKTYIATTIENPGIYKIKVSTEYQGMKVSTSKQVIIYEDKEETTNIEQLNKTTLQINIDSKQEVDPANNNITIKGNVEVQNNNGEIKLNLFIHKKGSDELTLCKITLEQSKEFQCQLNAPIEIGTYLIEANLNIINENSNLTKSKEIELYLKDSNEINLETEIIGNTTYEPIIITTKTEKQTNLGITIISPTNKETYKYTSNESFKTEFLPEEEGEYTVLFELTKSDKYRKVEQKITVHKSEQPFKITAIQKEFENNSITFNIELPSIKRNNNTNLQLNITTPEEGIWTVCEYIIQPNESKFNITCPTNTGIILGEYQTTAKIEINGTNLTTSTTFKIGIDESNIEITSKGIQRYTLEKIILKTNDENITKVYGNLLGEKESINLVFTRITKDLFEAEVFLTEKEYKLQLNTLNKEGISSKLFEINTTLPNQTIKLENREYTQNSNNTVLISTISEFNSIVAKFIGNGRDIQTIEFNKLELGIYTANMLLTDKEYTVILTATIENITIQEEFKINTTDNSQTLQKEAKINENVKWITIRSSNKIEVPITATEITIKDTDNNTIVTNNNIIETKTRLNPQELVNKTKELAQKELALSKLETQKQILDEKTGKIITKLIANNEISKSEKELNIIKNQIKEVIENSTLIPDQKIIITDTNNIISNYNEVIVEYKTPAPTKQEKVISENRKQVIVKSDFHYQNITTETIITPTEKGKVKLFWYINGTKTEVTNNEEINLEELDEDNDGLIEKLRWNTPHTSTQTFEIEIIIPENINIENIQTIDDKLLVVSAKINTTSTLKLGSIKGVFASEIYCGDLNTYIDSLNETEIENIYQYIQDAENDNLVVSKYNTAINQTYYNWNCEDTIVTFTLQDPASLEKENIYLQLDQEKEYITPNNNLNLEIIYSQEDLTNSSIKDVEFSIITTENGTQINPDEITIDLINIDDTKEQRIFTNISGVLTFTINKDKNLYKEIDITTKKDSSIKVQSIIINPSIENNINIGENVEFSIDNIISAEIKDIDDNNADFTTIITSTKITAVPNENIRPGLYQIIITQANYTQKIWFTYGLLAANLNKPIYHNEEPAKFEIVVLDNKGFLVKDADISIRIERPDGFLEILTTSSNEVKLTSRGTYDATYYLENLGNYNVTITATTNDKIISITKNILAKESYDFDIIRNSKTTIDPWTEDFTTEFTLKSYIGINKFTFTEKIPKEFNITKSNSNEIREDNEYKYLIWNNIDNSFVPKYTAQTPLLTPYLYNIGAAEITYGGVLGIGETKFIENRTWMLAIDPVSQGNALLFWASGFHNAEMQYSPRYRTFNPDTSTLGSTQSDIPNAPAGNFNHPTWLEVARHPFKPEVIAIWESNEGGPRRVYGAVWNGSSWGALQTFSADTGTAYKALDVAYESNSGNAMVVYAVTGSNVPRYRVWNGTTWTAEQNANDIGSTPRFIRLVANPSITSNELILATNDALADVNVQVWNGATWGAVNEVTNNCWADRQCFDIAYESTSGDALIAYRHDATTNIYYNTYSGGVWSGRNAQGSLTAQPRVIQLASDPNSNRIIAGIVDDNTQDFHTFMWSGAGWTDMGTPSTSVNYENGMPFDITFEALSGDAIIAYGEGTAMRYRIVASGTTTLGAEQTVDTWGWTIAGVRLEHGEFTDHVYLSGMTAYYDIGFGIWNGATWAETGLAIGGGLDTTHQQYRMLASTEFFNTKAPTASSYGLNITNGAYLRRNGQVLAYSYWNDADRGLTYPAYIEHNGNGTSLEKIITPTDKWANYTLDISNYTEFNHVGRVDVSNIRATDLGQYGETGYIGWFFILDESNVTTITRSQSIADQNELFNISCRVYDKDMTKTIEDYTVFFYINNTYVGNTRSNSTGWATYQTSISEPDFYRINCSIKNSTYYVIDTAENILSTTITILDSTAPEATLNLPDNNTQDIDGNIVFNYTVTDTYSNIASCELIINGTVQATDNTITQGINTFPIALANGRYLWSVNCTDDSTNNNEGHSISRIITVRPDTTPPVIQQLEPPNGADSFSFVQIKFNASDELSDVDSCTLILDGITNETKTVNYDGEIQTINLTLASGIHTWRVNCSDDSPQNNWILSNWWVFTVGNDNTPPVITILSPNDGATDTDGDIHIYFTVNDYMSEIDSCTLYVNGLANQTNNSVNESYTQHFLIPGLSEASYNYYISCIDDSTNSNWDNSETRTVIVNYDYDAPVITLLYPENEYQSISGNINFIYTVADETEIKNCSLLINGTINKTDTTITRGINQSFSLTNIPINKYEWNVECYDNSDSHNYNTGTALNFSVGPDTIGPEITLISPSNNSIDTDGEILFTYITNDVTSNIASCEVFVNGSSVDVDNTVSEKVYQFLTGTLTDGRYEWFISCTDDSPQANVETSPTQYFNVSVNFKTSYDIELDDHYVAQGELIAPNSSFRDFYNNPLDNAQSYAYIIRNLGVDNQTTGWWDNSWTRRVEIPVTNVGTNSYTNGIIRFTLDTQSLIAAGLLRADCADLRFADQGAIPLNFYFWNADRACNNAATDILLEMNNIWDSNTHRIGVYFNNSAASTQTTTHNEYLVVDNFDNGDTITGGYWSAGSTTPLGGVSISNAQRSDGTNSARLIVDCTGNACDWAIERTSFEKTIIVTEDSTLTWRWIRATATSDLRFYLDGTLTDTSGTAWATATENIPAGTHTIKWEFRTTGTGGAVATQTAYVDQVRIETNNINIGTTTTQSEPVTQLTTQTTNMEGQAFFSWDTTGQAYGNYAVTGYGKKSSYWSDYSGYHFKIGPDIEAPTFNTWGLNVTDGTIVHRGERVLAYSTWEDKVNLSNALAEHNGTGSFTNYTITGFTKDKTATANYILDTSDFVEFSELGRINVNTIYANDSSDNWNKTTPPKYFILTSESQLSDITTNATILTEGENISIDCRVLDEFTGNPIQNHNIMFYYNNNLIGTSSTDATGWATITTLANIPGTNVEIRCSIINNLDIYYYAGTPNSISTYVNVTDITPPNVTLYSPQNNTQKIFPTFALGFSSFDSGVLDTCSLYGSWGGWHLEQTKTSLDNGNFPTLNYFLPVTFSQGQFYWYVTCNDTQGNIGSSINFTFNVSLSAPTVTLVAPQNNGTMGAGELNLTFSANQPESEVGIMNCTLSINNVLNDTLIGPLIKTQNYNFTIPHITYGTYNWTVDCYANNTLSANATRTVNIIELDMDTIAGNKDIDRDSVSGAMQDDLKIIATELYGRENINVSFLVNLTDPIIGTEVNKIIGWNLTNSSGKTSITFNPNSSVYAGNYTIWTRFSNWTYSVSRDTEWFDIFAGININFNNPVINPNNHYYYGELLDIESSINSLGIESTSQLGIDYGLIPKVILESPNGAKNTNLTLPYITNNWTNSINTASIHDHGIWNATLGMNTTQYFIVNNVQSKTFYMNLTGFGIPTITRIIPQNNFATANPSITFEWTVNDSLENNNWCNLTIDGVVNRSNLPTFNNTPYSIIIPGFSEGQHNWSLICWDYANNTNSTNTWNFTLDLTNPQINFTSPTEINNIVVNRNWTFVNVTVIELNLDTITLEWNNVNETLPCTGTSPNYFCEVNKTNLIDGNYSYIVYANDSLGNENKTEYRYIGIDTTNPLVDYALPTLPNASSTNHNWLYVRIDVTEPYLDTAILEWNGVNETMTCAGVAPNRFCYVNKTSLPDGDYTFKTYVNDTMSHRNQTIYRVNYIDTTNPLIQFVPLTDYSNFVTTRNWTYINVTVNETTLRNVTLQWNGVNESLICIGSTPNYYCGINKTNLIDWNYSYIVYANDSLGNKNNTEIRYIGIDTTNPLVNYSAQTLANASSTNNNWLYVRIDVTESYLDTATLEWNNVNETMTCAGVEPNRFCYVNKTSLADGTYTFKTYVNDTMSHNNQTVYRVNYVDSTAPKIQFVAPTESTNTVIPRNWTVINVTINETTLENVTLQWNGVNEPVTCIGSGPNYYCELNKSSLTDGNYSYFIFVNDSVGNSNNTELRYIGIDTTNPLVDYALPTLPNASSTNNNWLYVRIDVTEPYLDTAILEWNSVNETMTCAGVAPNRFCYVNKTSLADGTYTFKTYVNDTMSHTNETEYRTNYVDSTAPKIQFVSPTESTNTVIPRNWTVINVTVNETTLRNVTLQWNGVNESLTCVGTGPNYYCEINKTNIIDGNYSYIAYANDSLTNKNSTEIRYIAIDTTNPLVDYALPTLSNASSTSNDWLYVRIDVTEPYLDTAILEWNSVNETMTCAGVAPNRFCYVNKTSLADGTYTFKTYVNDTMSHTNETEYRTNYVDSTAPKIQFVSPTESTNTVIPRNWTYINVTINETTPENITLQWNGVNESLTCIGVSPDYYCGINKTSLADGNYSYLVYVNDSVGNSNKTETRYIYIDTTAPIVNFVAPTPNNNNVSAVNWTFIQISDVEYNHNNATLNWNGTNYAMSCAGARPNYNCWINLTDLTDGNYSYYACATDINNLTSCTETRNITILRLFYLIDMNPSLKAILTYNNTVDAATVGLSGLQYVTLQTIAGINISNFTVDYNQDHNWSNVTADINTTTGISYIHVPSGHNEISTSKTLYIPVILGLGSAYICPDAQNETQVTRTCTNIDYRWNLINESGFYKVNVSGTGGHEGTLANLTIFDDTNDPEGENLTHIINQNVGFYANFTNITNSPIDNTNGVTCEITFNVSGIWSAPASMIYNSSTKLWQYYRSFTSEGTFNYNITCNGTRQAYELLQAQDNFTLNATAIFINNVSATPSFGILNTPIMISANITSPIALGQAWLNVTGPTGTYAELMVETVPDIYNYTFPNTNAYGTYTYSIWVSDSFGNAIQSTSYTFQIVGVNSKSYIYTENTSYGINEIVNLKNESNLNDWWNYAWNKRKAILLSEGQGIERTNEIITLNITDLNLTNYCDELRIVSKWSGTPTETPYQLLDNGTNWCEVLFLANISSHATNEEIFHAYFENPAAAAPVYSDQVILSAFGGEANHQISATNYLLQFETTNDLPETFISRVGTYQQDFIDEWGGCNGAGMVSDTSASWRDECNDAGVVTLIEDGTLRSILNIYKSNLGTLDYINKTYVFYPTYFTIEVTIRGGGTSNTNNNEVSFIRVNYAAEGGEPFRNFNFETSTGTDPDTIECSGGHELVGGWSSDWASVFRTGFEASYSFQVVSDPLSSINSYEYYEGGVECGASSKQDIDIDNDEVSGPVTLGFIPHGEENTNLFARDDSIKLKNPVTVVLDSEKTANETFSVIINSGLVSFNGSVVMTIEYFNTTISNWQHITTIVNETATSTVHTILPNTYLNTGNLWNPTSWNTSTYPSGTYRATQILLNSSDEPVLNQNGSSIYKDYEFQIYYERSSVNQSYLTNNNILDSETAEMNCQIFDPTTNTAHENYLVSFYRNGTLLGTNTTNASGYAIFRWTESIGTYFIVCNITDDLPNSIYATDPTEGVDILTVWPAGADTTKPIITAVSDTPDPANISDTITIRANVTDNKNVSLVQVFVRRPGEDTWTPFNMTEINVGATGNGTYEFNYTLTNMGGYFTYYVYAEDNWTTPNWQRSSYQNFFIAVVKAISKIKTEETLYKGMTDVLIDSYTTYKTTDVEPGSQSTSMKYSYFTNGFEDSSGIGLAGLNVTIWNFQNGDGNDIDITNTVRNSGTYALHLQDGNPVSWVESNAGLINLSGQTSCNISIARRVDSMEGTDDWANLDIFDGSWNNGIGVWGPPQSGFGWATQSYSLDSYNLIENFQIRMRMTSTADDDEAYFDDIAITCENDDQSENYVNYNIGGIATINTSYVELTIQVDEYDSRGSTTTTEPDIQVGIWTGSSYLYNNYCELDKIYDSNSYTVNSRNCTIVIDNPTIVAAWENPANRNIRVRGTFLDANSNGIDKVQWSGIWGTFVTPSIIANTGSREINGRILLQVYNNDTNTLVGTVYNQSYNISVDEKINISSIWNSNPFNTLNFPTGTYYAYSAVVNDVGAVIQNPSGSFVEDKSYFNLQYMTVNITSPIDNTTYLTDNITLNATLDTTYFASGGWCGYSLDGQINITMTQLNPINFTYQLESLSGGNHSVIVYCNDSAGDISMSQNVTFNVDKDTVSIIYPTFEYLLDRDETQSAYNDSVNLTVRTGEFIAGLNVSYYIKRVEPNSIADQNNSILIGSVLTNASGYAVLPFNPNSSIYAGNYSWWGEIPAGTSMQNGTLLIYGSLNTIFTNINSQPEQYYLKTENIEINSTIESMGIENFTILNNTYNFTTLYNISSPSAIKVYDNLTRNGNYFVGNYLTAITDETGIWNATLYSNAKYFFAVNTSRDFSVANKIAVIGKLTYDDTNSPNIIFNLSITNLVNATINTTAFIYVPSNYLLTGINETATTKILSGIYDGRSHQVNLTLNNYQTKIIAYNATLTYNSSRKMQEAIMFGIDPR